MVKTLRINIDSASGSASEVDEATLRLRSEIEQTDVESVERVRGVAPANSKGDGQTLGSLLVTLASSGGVLTTLIGAVQSFVTRNQHATVTVEIDGDKITIPNATEAERRALLKQWIARHEQKPAA